MHFINRMVLPKKLIFGVEDPGQLSCHKVGVVVVHYDAEDCLRTVAERLEEIEKTKVSGGGNSRISSRIPHPQVSKRGETLTDPSTNNRITKYMEEATRLILKHSQTYVKDMVRRRLNFRQENRTAPGLDEEWAMPTELPPKHAPHCLCLCQYIEKYYFRARPKTWFDTFCV